VAIHGKDVSGESAAGCRVNLVELEIDWIIFFSRLAIESADVVRGVFRLKVGAAKNATEKHRYDKTTGSPSDGNYGQKLGSAHHSAP